MVWSANEVGELFAVTPSLRIFPDKSRVSEALKFYVNQVVDGNRAEFARQIEVPKNTFWLWCNGSHSPTLKALVRICYYLNVPLLSFLRKELLSSSQEKTTLILPPTRLERRANPTLFDTTYLQHIQWKLQEFLTSNALPPISMEEAARRLGHDRRTIYRHFSELCNEMSSKYDNYQNARYLEEIEQACTEVHRVVLELQAESIYPSEARVSE